MILKKNSKEMPTSHDENLYITLQTATYITSFHNSNNISLDELTVRLLSIIAMLSS